MAVETISLDGEWQLKDYAHKRGEAQQPYTARVATKDWITTPVPGDIHPTLVDEGRLPEDMFMGTNVEKCRWTGEREWWFRKEFTVPKRFSRQTTELVFEGIDLYGSVWVNGKPVGETKNSFRPYRFDVTQLIKPGETNTVTVRVGATLKILDAMPWKKYFACFNLPRIFARKAQCQFSWDWAPHLPALGIWKSVRLETFDSGRVMDVAVRPRNDGQATFHITIDERTYRQDLDQKQVSSKGQSAIQPPEGDLLVEVFGPENTNRRVKSVKVRHRMPVHGQKSFCTVSVPNPQLWWPAGSGDQPLYRYRVTLIRKGKTHHEVEGRFAFREVRVIEEPIGTDKMSFRFEVNCRPIFCKGANTVPLSCFPGTVTREQYRHLIRLARAANYNMLRVWGGGIYESDHFYEACDELGIMVWQDFMFACSDVPDDDPQFIAEVTPEIEHQIKRLRNHPSIVFWCGGNEKTGSAGFKISYGEHLFHVIAAGLAHEHDPTREYRPASPHSYTDLGNHRSSGDSHGGSYEKAFVEGSLCWREKMIDIQSVFHSEFGFHGPTRYDSLKRFVPEDEIWPLSEAMEYHVQDNPYNPIPETFAQVQAKMAEILVGDIEDAESFVRCTSTFHAELLQAEIEHHRRLKWTNAGAMIWMFNDCWPCASWSVVDYYFQPKPAYYATLRANAPVIITIIEEPQGYDVYVVNDTFKSIAAPLLFGQERVDGVPFWQYRRQVSVPANSAKCVARIKKSAVKSRKHTYLFAALGAGRNPVASRLFFHHPWREIDWPDPGLTWKLTSSSKASVEHPAIEGTCYVSRVNFRAKQFARMVHLDGAEGPGHVMSDNFFDVRPGESKTIEIRSPRKLDADALRVRHWLDRWD